MNREPTSPTWDCIIVGAGPAGLNAALVLGRARRRVLLIDNGSPRSDATHEMHGVPGHDGLDPAELRARGRAELAGARLLTLDSVGHTAFLQSHCIVDAIERKRWRIARGRAILRQTRRARKPAHGRLERDRGADTDRRQVSGSEQGLKLDHRERRRTPRGLHA